jgi:predicted hydrocarbon binding protein
MNDHDTPSGSAGPAGGGLRDRLRWSAADGAIHDGPRRYLMMRPDVLMGVLRRLPADERARVAEAFADAVADHGVDSIRAYFRQVGEDPSALLASTKRAAADLGWGAWRFEPSAGRLGLSVQGSPFAQGFGASDAPVCAPIRGMLRAVAGVAAGVDADVREVRCVACGDPRCEFEARWAGC